MRSTCSHGAFPGKPKKPFFLQYKAATDEYAGADGQDQANVEVVPSPVLTHCNAGCAITVRHIDNHTL